MQICSFLTESFIEYEGEVSLVVFTKECNLNCWGCYNKNLMKENSIDFIETLEKFLTPLHTAIVFLGGEPTCNSHLKDMILYVRKNYPELKIKVYTNGLNLKVIEEIEPFVDTFSVDFKVWNNKNNLLGVNNMTPEHYFVLVNLALEFLHEKDKLSEIRTVDNPKLGSSELNCIKEYVKIYYPKAKHIVADFIQTD